MWTAPARSLRLRFRRHRRHEGIEVAVATAAIPLFVQGHLDYTHLVSIQHLLCDEKMSAGACFYFVLWRFHVSASTQPNGRPLGNTQHHGNSFSSSATPSFSPGNS